MFVKSYTTKFTKTRTIRQLVEDAFNLRDMSYLKSYSAFEADGIRGCNNTIKNIIDLAQRPRRMRIEEALATLEPIQGSRSPPTYRHPPADAQHLL